MALELISARSVITQSLINDHHDLLIPCPCREMRPEFARAARELKKFGRSLGKVDASTEVSLEEEFGVKERGHFSQLLMFQRFPSGWVDCALSGSLYFYHRRRGWLMQFFRKLVLGPQRGGKHNFSFVGRISFERVARILQCLMPCSFRNLQGSYPKLMLFLKGARVGDYEGEGDWPDLVDYVRKNADPEYASPPSPTVTLSHNNFTDFVKDKRVVMVSE